MHTPHATKAQHIHTQIFTSLFLLFPVAFTPTHPRAHANARTARIRYESDSQDQNYHGIHKNGIVLQLDITLDAHAHTRTRAPTHNGEAHAHSLNQPTHAPS